MKKKSHIQEHPNQEDKRGKAVYGSTTKVNSSTNSPNERDVNMPEGAESDYKKELLQTKKKSSSRTPETPKQ
jgi:hypothetical protein